MDIISNVEEECNNSGNSDCNDFTNFQCNELDETECDQQPAGQRWDPLGAASEESDSNANRFSDMDRIVSSNLLNIDDSNRIKSLEEEQEMLSSSLLALTSHFAQVQLRLRQIVAAPPEERDKLLQSLDEFAFRGIPEMTTASKSDQEHLFKAVERQRQCQFELIEQLKLQLMEVEKFAYESGAKVLPQSILVEKQKVIIDELKNKVNLKVSDDDLPQLSSEDLRNQVDCALGEFVGPVKMKDTLVGQLKTQIADLERFVAYLQLETNDLKQMTKAMTGFKNSESMVYNTYNTKMAKQRREKLKSATVSTSSMERQTSGHDSISTNGGTNVSNNNIRPKSTTAEESLSRKAGNLLDKASSILNIFAVTQLGCGSGARFRKNTLKRTTKGNHWGDLRAQLEVDIQEIISLVSAAQHQAISSSDSDDSLAVNGPMSSAMMAMENVHEDLYTNIQLEITRLVRKNFAITLQKLIEHGLHEDVLNYSTSLVPFRGCFTHAPSTPVSSMSRRYQRRPFHQSDSKRKHHSSTNRKTGGRSRDQKNDDEQIDPDESGSSEIDEEEEEENEQNHRQMHVWELILQYYYIKNGDKFNETPARKLSESFNLDIAGTSSSSNKQSLLCAIGSIISVHAPYKRSYNSHFKALVSTGLNTRKLTQWLNLLFQCNDLIDQYYSDWSYVARTGFRDALKSIDRLSQYQFNLPVDIAVRQFQNIKDVFM